MGGNRAPIHTAGTVDGREEMADAKRGFLIDMLITVACFTLPAHRSSQCKYALISTSPSIPRWTSWLQRGNMQSNNYTARSPISLIAHAKHAFLMS